MVVVLGLAGCGGGDEPAAEDSGGTPDLSSATIVLGGNVTAWAPAYVGVCEGFFTDYGLDVEVVASAQGTTAAIAGLVSGDALSALAGAPALVGAVREGAPIQLVFNLSIGYNVQITVSNELLERAEVSPDDPLEDRVRALQGARIGILNPGDSTDQLLRFMLPQYDMNADQDVTLTAVSNTTNAISALSQGNIDAFGGSPPSGAQAEQQGFGQILLTGTEVEGLADYPLHVGSINIDAIESDAEVVKALVKGLADSLDLLRDDPEAGEDCVREQFPDMDVATFDAAYASTVENLPDSPLLTEDAFQSLADFSEASGSPLGMSYEETVAANIVQEALDER